MIHSYNKLFSHFEWLILWKWKMKGLLWSEYLSAEADISAIDTYSPRTLVSNLALLPFLWLLLCGKKEREEISMNIYPLNKDAFICYYDGIHTCTLYRYYNVDFILLMFDVKYIIKGKTHIFHSTIIFIDFSFQHKLI